MHRIPPLAAIRAFEAAARHSNFTKAGDELGMTQAAISYQIKSLEDRLEIALFHREKGRVILTESGARLAPLVTQAFDRLEDAFTAVRQVSESVITISSTNTFAANWLAPRLGGFQMKRPELAVRLHTSDSLVDFARDGIDVAVRTGARAWPGLDARRIMRIHIAPLASPEFLSAHPPVRTPDDIMRMPRLTADHPWWELWYRQAGGTGEITPPPPGIRLDSQLMEGRAALAGQGVAILMPDLWNSEIEAGRLVQPLGNSATWDWSYWVVSPVHTRNAPKIRAFREWITAEIAREGMIGEVRETERRKTE